MQNAVKPRELNVGFCSGNYSFSAEVDNDWKAGWIQVRISEKFIEWSKQGKSATKIRWRLIVQSKKKKSGYSHAIHITVYVLIFVTVRMWYIVENALWDFKWKGVSCFPTYCPITATCTNCSWFYTACRTCVIIVIQRSGITPGPGQGPFADCR